MRVARRLLIAGFLIFFFGLLLRSIFGPPAIQLLPNEPVGERPSSDCFTAICSSLLREIERSQQSISFAIYGFRGQPAILTALLAAQQRGVTVRGVVDKDAAGQSYYSDTEELITKLGSVTSDGLLDRQKALAQKNKEGPATGDCRRPDNTEGPLSCFNAEVGGKKYEESQASHEEISFSGDIMHDKFFVFDGARLWTGSANVSDSCSGGYNANLSVIVADPSIAGWYEEEFNEMYEGRFHKAKKVHTSKTVLKSLLPGGTSVEAFFSPQGKAMERSVVALIGEARRSIDIAVFYLTNKAATTALLEAQARGVDIRIIIDASGASNAYSKHALLRKAGIAVKVEDWGGKMHAKTAVVDDEHLVMGSMNWTSAGDTANDENTLVFRHAPAIARQYNEWYAKLWSSIDDRWLKEDAPAEGLLAGSSCQDGLDNDYDHDKDEEDSRCKK